MILANTKATGYSLGLPLWWPANPDNLSTGCLQGISLTLMGAYTEVYLTKYFRQDSNVSMVFSTPNEILCSLDVTLTNEPSTYQLQGESDIFVSGFVTIYAVGGNLDVDLSGAQVCPRYINFVNAPSNLTFKLIDSGVSSSASVNTLTPTPSANVRFVRSVVSGAIVYSAEKIESTQVSAIPENTGVITHINGISVINGEFNLILGNNWTVGCSGGYVKIGNISTENSCPDANYIESKLAPGNYAGERPLNMAFDGNTLVMSKVYDARFNTEYENGGSGLAWNEFSSQHDFIGGGNAN